MSNEPCAGLCTHAQLLHPSQTGHLIQIMHGGEAQTCAARFAAANDEWGRCLQRSHGMGTNHFCSCWLWACQRFRGGKLTAAVSRLQEPTRFRISGPEEKSQPHGKRLETGFTSGGKEPNIHTQTFVPRWNITATFFSWEHYMICTLIKISLFAEKCEGNWHTAELIIIIIIDFTKKKWHSSIISPCSDDLQMTQKCQTVKRKKQKTTALTSQLTSHVWSPRRFFSPLNCITLRDSPN